MVEETPNLDCRFYEEKYPAVGDIVMAQIKSVADNGAYMSLLEYGGIEGMIVFTEFSMKRIRSANKHIKIGKMEVVEVLRVDYDKGYIDLSKKRLSAQEIEQCHNKYNKSKTVHSILKYAAEVEKEDLEGVYQKFGWPLYKKHGHAYDAFLMSIANPEEMFQGVEVSEGLKAQILGIIKNRMKPQPVKIRADFEITCFSYDGIDAIKDALREGQKMGTEENEIKFKLISSPKFVVVTTTENKNEGIKLLNETLKVVESMINSRGGNFSLTAAPAVMGDQGIKELEDLIKKKNEDLDQNSSGEEDNEEGIVADIGEYDEKIEDENKD